MPMPKAAPEGRLDRCGVQPGVVHAGGRPGNPSVPQTLGFGLQIPGLLLATAQHPLTGRAWSFLPESSLQSTPPLLGSGALRTRTHLPLQGSQSLPPGRQSLLSPEWELGPLASGPLVGWHLCGPGGHCSTGWGGRSGMDRTEPPLGQKPGAGSPRRRWPPPSHWLQQGRLCHLLMRAGEASFPGARDCAAVHCSGASGGAKSLRGTWRGEGFRLNRPDEILAKGRPDERTAGDENAGF